jgi:mannonate dehydratase
MAAIMSEAIDLMARRGTSLPMRPDHGARMLGDLQNDHFYPGYSAIGRLRGLAELRGLEMGLRHHKPRS